jgi:hypothetical protein
VIWSLPSPGGTGSDWSGIVVAEDTWVGSAIGVSLAVKPQASEVNTRTNVIKIKIWRRENAAIFIRILLSQLCPTL